VNRAADKGGKCYLYESSYREDILVLLGSLNRDEESTKGKNRRGNGGRETIPLTLLGREKAMRRQTPIKTGEKRPRANRCGSKSRREKRREKEMTDGWKSDFILGD